MQSGDLIVYNIFSSINGEVCISHQGSMCMFIRLAGCNLRCKWCDTLSAQSPESGYNFNIPPIMKHLRLSGHKNVTITGGEPMMQKEGVHDLCLELLKEGYTVSIETNGSIDFEPFQTVSYVVDYKMPSSGHFEEMDKNIWDKLRYKDFIKFVVANREDYQVAKMVMNDLKSTGAVFAISPILLYLPVNLLIKWLEEDSIRNVIISVQLHKLLHLMEPQ